MNRTLSVTFALLFSWACFQSAFAQGNFVYINSNYGRTAGMNSVVAFRNDGFGNLSQVPGSPFLTEGTGVFDPHGVLNPTDADQQVIVNPQGTFLYAVNSHSNSIAVFSIRSNGALTAVPGSPFASGGLDPVSLGLDLNRGLMVAVNRDGDPTQPMRGTVPNYTTFIVGGNGSLSPTQSSVPLVALSRPEQAVMDQADNVVIGVQYETSNIVSYQIGATGALTTVTKLGPPIAGAQPLGSVLNPNQRVLYVSFPVAALIGIYTYDASGALTFLQTIPAVGGNCWMAINTSGSRLYVADSGIASVSVYDTTVGTLPVLLQTLALRNATRALNMALDPTENFLYVLDVLNNKRMHVLQVLADGTLLEHGNPINLPVPQGAAPVGIATVME
jgi:6-phosphogluconolactonase (cycloisomerase 2 family)